MPRYQAIILKKLPIREHDELVVCYTKHAGKQRYVAKSSQLASSLQGSHLDVLNHVAFGLVEGKYHDIMTSTLAISSFPKIKASLQSLANAFFLLQCFDQLVYDGERDEKLWDFLLRKLINKEETKESELLDIMGHDASVRFSDLAKSANMAVWKTSL